MQKTTNYQLNQWEPSDPIRREDFNADNAAIDAAIKSAEDKAAQAQTAHEACDTQLWNGLLQMGERYLKERYAAMDETALTQEDNLLLNPLTSAEMAEDLTGAEWDSTQKVNIGRRETVDRTYLRTCSTGHENGTIGPTFYRTDTATYDFTVPKAARITDFDLQYYVFFSETNNTLTNVSMTFQATRKSGSSYVSFYTKSGLTLELSGTSTKAGSFTVPVEIDLEQGVEYRFTITLDSGYGATSQFGFVQTTGSDNSRFTVELLPITEGSHVRLVPLVGECSRGLAVFRWRQEEGDGGVTPTLNGVPMEELSRTGTADGDGTVYEVTGLFTGRFADSAVLSVGLTSSATDLVQLTGYGLLML